MDTSTDIFGYSEVPYIILANPSKTEICSLALAYNTKLTLRFNALSEFTFDFPKSIDGNLTTITGYDSIQNKRLVLIENYGYFQIVESKEISDGAVPRKSVTCKSLENELTNKRVSVYSGTKALYNVVTPANTILYDMVQLAPNWSVGDVDTSLQVKFRTFQVSDTNIYNFLMNEVCTAFECVFIFDTVNKTISAKTLTGAVTATDIFLSFDNVIKTSEFTEKSDEITTGLAVYGGGPLTIAGVNPLGTNKIYDFSYYATMEWMSQNLVTAIASWEAVIAANQAGYADALTTLKNDNNVLLQYKNTLAQYQAEYSGIEEGLKIAVEVGNPTSALSAQLNAKQLQIDAELILIADQEAKINAIDIPALNLIIAACSFTTNFTPTQLAELNEFIYENTYKNEFIIQTDNMTFEEIQTQEQALYDQAQSVLDRISQPRYEFNLESVNYTAIPDFSVFTAQTEPGVSVTAEINPDVFITAVLLEISFSFNNPKEFTLKFSNRLRLDNGNFVYSDLLGSVVKTGSNVSFNSQAWGNWETNYKDDVTTFIDSALNTARNEIINSTKQEIVISPNGLRGKQYISEGVYDPNQVWLTSSILSFTSDNWNTARLALGKVTSPSGATSFGLVADTVVGHLIAGNQLTISNTKSDGTGSNFILNGDGAFLNNASLTMTTNNNKILLDPDNTFKIQQKVGGIWTNRFEVNTDTGDVTFSGKLSGASGNFTGAINAASGYIGGWSITNDGLQDDNGNYIHSDGNVRLGPLTIVGDFGTFNGTFSATNLIGQVDNPQITDSFDASKLTFGTINTGVLFAGEINWGANARMYNYGYGISAISGHRILIMQDDALDTYIDVQGGGIALTGTNAIQFRSNAGAGSIFIQGEVSTENTGASGTTINAIRHITTSSGDFYFKFVNGMLVDVYA